MPPLNIRNEETEQLAATLAQLTGETKTEAVTQALRERLQRVAIDLQAPAAGSSPVRSGERGFDSVLLFFSPPKILLMP